MRDQRDCVRAFLSPRSGFRAMLAVLALLLAGVGALEAAPPPLKVLFLGDNGHHRPADRFRQLLPVFQARGITLTYADTADSLTPENLAKYDALMVYANLERITPAQEKALLDYVEGGKGFVPLHCASYCFLNSPKYIELVGAQFRSHGTGTFRTTVAAPDHPIMKGYRPFESWDETYVHHRHNEKDRTVLEYRVDRELREPWTWVRTQGKGRVFYTAWGHDERTWSNPGFQALVERGLRWAVGQDPAVVAVAVSDEAPEMTAKRKDVKPFEYQPAKVPFYPAGGRWGTQTEPLSKMQKPLDPAESQKHLVTPIEFETKLVAAEPQIGKPIALNWDERGRLWVAETVDYPNEKQPEGKGRDRIRICEDTDGDGVADKFTVFADKLSLPTSLTFARGGVIVLQPPQTLFLKDTDGDDRADVREVLFTGWSTADTHAGPSNLQYGLDNWIYGMVGYSGFAGVVGGERMSFRTGFFRFRPDGSKMEFLRNTNNNSWGVGISEEGLIFGSTANGNPSEYLPIPNRYYEPVRGWSSRVLGGIAGNAPMHPITDQVRQVDFHGHFTAAAGHALYTARRYPQVYWNRAAFVAEPTGHLVATFLLKRQGSGFSSRNAWNLLASDDEWTAPIVAEVGPDGNVWVIDWYNYIVQHNPTPTGFRTGKGNAYETDLRDKTHGRVYRLVPRDGKPDPVFTLKDAGPDALVAALKNDNFFWRRHAQRLLVERGKTDVVPGLLKLVNDTSTDAIGLNPGAIHALWTLHGLGALGEGEVRKAVKTALGHPSAGVRRNAVAVLATAAGATEDVLGGKGLGDEDAHVRLATLLTLAEAPADPRAGEAIVRMLLKPENYNDTWIPDAATAAAARNDLAFLKAVAATGKPVPARVGAVVGVVAEHYARGGPTTVRELALALTEADPAVAEAVLASLARGWPRNRTVEGDAQLEAALEKLLPRVSTGGRGQLIRLAMGWGLKGFSKHADTIAAALVGVIEDAKQSDAKRADAARQLVEFRPDDKQTVEKLLEGITPRTSPTLTVALFEALRASRAEGVGEAVVERLAGMPPSAREAGLRLLLGRTETIRALLDAIDAGKVQLTELSLDQRQALAANPSRRIAERAKTLLARGGGLPSPDRQKVMERYLPLVRTGGEVAAGKVIYTTHCAKCHVHGGEGGKVGPDLTGMAVHPREELLTHILDPNRSVEGNFRVYTVSTDDGRVFNGILASETKTAVELIDAEGKKHALLRENIEELFASTKSLMPEGFEKDIPPEGMANLLAFLTQRGKFLPLPMEKAATIVSTRGMFYAETSTTERLVLRDWSPRTVEGVPFRLIDPQGDRVPNVILLYGPQGTSPPKMPKSVRLPCNTPASAVHLLSGVSGWGYPLGEKGSVTMIVRLHYADGKTEDHPLRNGEQFADYIRRVDVPGSKFAFPVRGQQMRFLSVLPQRPEAIREIELVKGSDDTAPIVMAVTVETR